MFRNPIVPWVLAVFGITMAVLFSVRADREEKRADIAETTLREGVVAGRLDNMQAATFVKIEGNLLRYRIPVSSEQDGEQFVSQADRTAVIDPGILISDSDGQGGAERLRSVAEGTAIGVRVFTLPDTGEAVVYAVTVKP